MEQGETMKTETLIGEFQEALAELTDERDRLLMTSIRMAEDYAELLNRVQATQFRMEVENYKKYIQN